MKSNKDKKDNLREKLKDSVDIAQRAQRNFDLTRQIPDADLETMIYAAENSPSKQSETHYALHVYTDPKIIRKIYNYSKRFCLFTKEENFNELFGEENGEYWQSDNRSLTNSQTLANALFAYSDADGDIRGCSHIVGNTLEDSESQKEYIESKNYSIGISVGELILSAAMLGYKTGICSSFNKPIAPLIGIHERVKLLVGIGYEDTELDRRTHPEVFNRDVDKMFKNGADNERWKFPSFEKNIDVFINGVRKD